MYSDAPDSRKPIGILMIEHRLIERALKVLERKINDPGNPPDVVTFAQLIEFFGSYSDDTHHGKEEVIVFEVAPRLSLPADMMKLMAELKEDHVRFRGLRRRMYEANTELAKGNKSALAKLKEAAEELIPVLRKHIGKEDKVFFPAFNAAQQKADRDAMKVNFQAADAELLHKIYKKRIEGME